MPTPQDPVERLVGGPPVVVHPDDTLTRIAELFVEDSIGAVVVVGEDGPCGMVTERDVVVAFTDDVDFEVDRAGDVMAMELVSVQSTQSVEHAASMMLDGGIRHLPVMDGEKLVGVVSIRDVLAAYV